jgi:hypothetical protein
MMIETTAYLDDDTRRALDAAARVRGVTRSALAVMLMRRVMKEYGKWAQFGRTVQYQEKNPGGNRRCAHLSLSERDYECFIDMRKFFKRSVSLLIAYAVVRYLDSICEEFESDKIKYYTDNNLFNNYFFSYKGTENYVCWTISWGIPEKIPL